MATAEEITYGGTAYVRIPDLAAGLGVSKRALLDRAELLEIPIFDDPQDKRQRMIRAADAMRVAMPQRTTRASRRRAAMHRA